MKTLTHRQQRFIDEYLVDLNATQAAIRSGYSLKTARAIGCENLTKPNIAKVIEDEQKFLREKTADIRLESALLLAEAEYQLIEKTRQLVDNFDIKSKNAIYHNYILAKTCAALSRPINEFVDQRCIDVNNSGQ